jgi:hypothetical protein
MDCDTTGVEPDFALVKFKKLSGGVVLIGRFGGDWGLEDVDEDYAVVGVEEDFGEELAYEAAGAGDKDLHCVLWCCCPRC